MVSTTQENVQAICLGLGFDSRQLHKYSFSAIKSFWTFFVFGLASWCLVVYTNNISNHNEREIMNTKTRNPYSYDCEVQEVPSCNTTETRFVFSLDSWICEDCQDFLTD
jgi:hypothetical protein